MSRKLFLRLERILVALMLLGMVGMFQGWNLTLHARGFSVLGWSTLAYIVLTHWPVRDEVEG